jgi:flagellar biosynthesis protein FlhF
MAVKTYRGKTLKEALARVRKDLGGGAVILGTRETKSRRLFGFGVRELVEVTAHATNDEPPRRESIPASQGRSLPTSDSLDKQVGRDLSKLHGAVEALMRQGRIDTLLPDLPADLVSTYAGLLDSEVPEPLARRLVRYISERLEPHELRDRTLVQEALCEAVESCVSVAPPIVAPAGARRVAALVGPTGVGKTTTIAKLAANFKLVRGLKPGLVTVDTYRIAAVEQLRTYAEIINVPLSVANSPDEMERAVAELGDVDIVLIDTAGRSPRDEVKIRELADFLLAATPDEVHLVLSAAAGERNLRAAVERFAMVQADRLILTKLDEAEGLGGLLALLGQVERPVSYITTGQAVPDDLEAASSSRLARLILGLEPARAAVEAI